MRRSVAPLARVVPLCVLASGQHAGSKANDRPYMVLQNQNLVLLLSVLGVILLAMIMMAVCVYRPPRRR